MSPKVLLDIVFRIPGKLKQFVFDLHSGKLHREFHHGPEPTDKAPGEEVRLCFSVVTLYFSFSVHDKKIYSFIWS